MGRTTAKNGDSFLSAITTVRLCVSSTNSTRVYGVVLFAAHTHTHTHNVSQHNINKCNQITHAARGNDMAAQTRVNLQQYDAYM